MYPHERTLVEEMSGRPFVLLGVNTDKSKTKIKKAVQDNGINWRSWLDGKTGGPICKQFKVRSFPTILLIDHEGVIRYHSGTRKEVRRKLDETIEHLVSIAESSGGGMREFVDASGTHKVMATYSKFKKGKVHLVDENDDTIKIPWGKLSVDDRNYIAGIRLREDGHSRLVNEDVPFPFGELRTFKDKSGKFTLNGTYIGLDRAKVIFWDKNGQEVRVGYSKLADETREYISKENKRRRGTP